MPTFFHKNYKSVIFGLFVLLHVFLFNVNVAEWGDSYRILRASNYIQRLSYPLDEKRPPLFSTVLAMRLPQVDPVIWGRGVMFIISLASFFVLSKVLDLVFKDSHKTKALALLLFALNPVYFYWSLRIYADVPLSFLSLVCFYLLIKWRGSITLKQSFLIGLVVGLAILTRFEGYLLFLSVCVGLVRLNIKNLKTASLHLTTFILGVVTFVIPFLIWRNPLTSTYFEEPTRRIYNFETLYIYLMSLLFLLGVVPAFGFLNKQSFSLSKNLLDLPKKYIGLSTFIILEFLLALLWPAAIPRLFVPVIPFLIIFLSPSIVGFFEVKERLAMSKATLFLGLFIIYVIGQHFLRLQFLSPHRIGFIVVAVLQLPILYSIFKKQFNLFLISIGVSMLLWSLLTVWLHKDVYTSLINAAEYIQTNVKGKVAYNDVSAVSDWYLNNNGRAGLSGYFIDVNDKSTLLEKNLVNSGTHYLLLTNEHNPDLNIDLKKRPYLTLVKEFSYMHGGRRFWSKVIKVGY